MSDQEKVTIRVTRTLLDWALQQTSTQCAIALAIKDADDDFQRPKVTQQTISFADARTGVRYTFPTPARLAKLIDDFDRDPTVVRPTSFTLDLNDAEVKPIRHATVRQLVKASKKRREAEDAVRPARSITTSKIYRPLRDTTVRGVDAV